MPYKDKQKKDEYLKDYYLKHKKEILTKIKERYLADPEKARRKSMEYYKKHFVRKDLPTEKQLSYWKTLKIKTAWNKGLKGRQVAWNKGKKNCMSKEGNERRIAKLKGRIPYNKGIKSKQCKDKHWNWKGGINPINDTIRKSLEYKLWNNAVFARDGYTCQKTGGKGGKIHAHHIQNFSQFPQLRFAIDNGITLSEKSHKDFHKKYGMKNNNREQLVEFLAVSSDVIYFNPSSDHITII